MKKFKWRFNWSWSIAVIGVLVALPWLAVLVLEWKSAQQGQTGVVALSQEGPCLTLPAGCSWHRPEQPVQSSSVNVYCKDGTTAQWQMGERPQVQGPIVGQLGAWKIILLKDEAKGEEGRAEYLLYSDDAAITTAYHSAILYRSLLNKGMGTLVQCPAGP